MTATAPTTASGPERMAAGRRTAGHEHPDGPPAAPPFTAAAYARAAGFFRAAGDPERLRTLAQLAGGEACVSELAAAAGAGLSTVSQRLRVLRAEGLVARRREGKHVYYRLADEHVGDLVASALAHASEAPPAAARAVPTDQATTGRDEG